MSARDFERELTVLLQRHAEDAMNRTSTHEEHERLQSGIEGRSRRNRRWALAGAAAAGFAAVAGFAVWAADPGDRDDSAPASDSQTPEEQLAQGFTEALAAGDTDRIRSYPATIALDEWADQNLRLQNAWSMRTIVHACAETSTSSAGTVVDCPYDEHAFHSEQMGIGPFTGNTYTIRVMDGRIASVEATDADGTNGLDDLFLAIGRWVQVNHPGDWEFMQSPATRPADQERWYRLWTEYSQEYADEMTEQTDDPANDDPANR